MNKSQIILLSATTSFAAQIIWNWPITFFLGAYVFWGWLTHQAVKKGWLKNDPMAIFMCYFCPLGPMITEWDNMKKVLEEHFGGLKKYIPTIRNPFVWNKSE